MNKEEMKDKALHEIFRQMENPFCRRILTTGL